MDRREVLAEAAPARSDRDDAGKTGSRCPDPTEFGPCRGHGAHSTDRIEGNHDVTVAPLELFENAEAKPETFTGNLEPGHVTDRSGRGIGGGVDESEVSDESCSDEPIGS